MKIKKLQLKNGYKRFYDLTIDLGEKPKKIIALIGPNGCGKSSVLDGMLFHNNSFGQLGNKGQKDYQYHSMNQTPNFDYQNIFIEFLNGSFQQIREEKRKIGKESTIFSLRSPYRYNSNVKVNELRGVDDIRLNNYGATTSSDLDDKMIENYKRLNIVFNKYLKDNDCKFSDAKKKIIGDLNKSLKNCLELEISDIGDIQDSKGTLFFKKTNQPKEFEFNVLSSGEKEVIDILLDLYLRKDQYNDTIFLLDEPELHINTSIQKNLLIEIEKLIDDNCQVWLTTHSIGFIRTLQEDLKEKCQIIQFKQEDNYASETFTLKPMNSSHANWKALFEVALDDLSHLICPKQIIYCEGKDKPGKDKSEKGLDAQVYNNIFSKEFTDTLFVSTGGNTELEQRRAITIGILSKVINDLNILVLKDRDIGSGKFISQEQREECLKKNNYLRIIKRWEIENYLYDKEVLKSYCINNKLKFNEEKYDQLLTNICDDNLKDKTGEIKLICSVTESINAEKFKIELSKYITEEMEVYKELKDCIF